MPQFREPTARDWRASLRYLALYLAAIVLGAVFIIPRLWPAGLVVWVITIFVGMLLLVRWSARNSGYRCRHCGHEFQVSVFTELVSPHGSGSGGWTYLRCPRCDRRSRARVLVRD